MTTYRRRRAQVLIIVGVVLSLLILSVAITLYAGSLQFNQFDQSTYNSAVLNISDDFNRVLTNILAGATLSFNSTADISTPRAWANTNFTDWVAAMQSTYSTSGIQSEFFPTNVSIGGGIETNDSLVKLFWYAPTAVSMISAGYKLNLTGQGLYGVSSNSTVLLQTTLVNSTQSSASCSNSKKLPASTQIYIRVLRENNQPVDDLGISSFKVDYFNNATNVNTWVTANNTAIEDLGGGNYILSVTASGGCAIPSPLYKYIILWVRDNRGILTESYSYTSVQYVIQENAIAASNPKPSEVYVLESINNGSIIWFNRTLSFGSGVTPVPIPIPPVKQLRVTTAPVYSNGTVGKFQNTPNQVEVWNSKYTVPTLEFANWRTRFDLGDKLVYDVSFAGANINRVAVNITWERDADQPPPQYLLQFSNSSNYWIVNNLQYSLGLVTNANLVNYEGPYSKWIDYNLQVNATFTNGLYYPNGTQMASSLYTSNGGLFPNGVYYPVAYFNSTSGNLINVTCNYLPPGRYVPTSAPLPSGAYFPNSTTLIGQIVLSPNEYACMSTGNPVNGTALPAGSPIPAGSYFTTGVIKSYLVSSNGKLTPTSGYYTPAIYNPWGYHVEYTLFGYDSFPFGGGTWFPAKLPWGPGTNEGWTVLPGPVRAVAYRVSDFSYEPPSETYYCSSGEIGCPTNHQPADFQFTQVILIPYNVSYFESFFTASALRTIPFSQQYVEMVGMIGGTETFNTGPNSCTSSANWASAYCVRPNWSAIQYTNLNLISGQYYNKSGCGISCPSPFHVYYPGDGSTTVKQIGHWISEYGVYRGQAIMLDDPSYNAALNAASKGNGGYWFWTTADGSRRVAEYDYATWNPSNTKYTIPKGTVITVNFGGWIYNGGEPNFGSLTSGNAWSNGEYTTQSTGFTSPQLYYQMFMVSYYPTIVNSTATGVP